MGLLAAVSSVIHYAHDLITSSMTHCQSVTVSVQLAYRPITFSANPSTADSCSSPKILKLTPPTHTSADFSYISVFVLVVLYFTASYFFCFLR